MWTLFCAEVWLEVERRDLTVTSLKAADVDAIAESFGKDRVAILKALAYLGVAGRKGAQLGGASKVSRPPAKDSPVGDAPAAVEAAARPARGGGGGGEASA